jgi:hypothetical protein
LDDAWRLAFFGGAGCSGAAIVLPSGASAGAASTALNGSAAADADELAGALPGATGGADVVCAATGAAVFGNAAFGAAAFAVADIAGWLGTVERKDARVSGFSLRGVAAAEADGDAGLIGAATVPGAAIGAAIVEATDGTAAARTLVTIARAATGVFSGSLGRSTRESTTRAHAVAPIAVATKTTRAVRAKLGAGAK